MAKINLLPWRTERRKLREREFYMMLGAASYLLAVVLLGFGGAKLFYSKLRIAPRLGWIVLFVLSGACLLQL